VHEEEARDIAEAVLDDVTSVFGLEVSDSTDDITRTTSVLLHSGSVSVVETTTLRIVLMRSANGSPPRLDHAGAKTS